MTDEELTLLPIYQRVIVNGSDYAYEGGIVSRFRKRRSGELRCVVEDDNGRLFIHNAKQISDAKTKKD